MTKRISAVLAVVFAAVLFGFGARAEQQQQPAQPAEAKPEEATVPNETVDAFIQLLDHDQWAKRQAATDELIKLGKPAIPRLKYAFMRSSSNHERQGRLKTIINTIVPPPPPPPPPIRRFHGQGMMMNPDGTPMGAGAAPSRPDMLDLLGKFGARFESTLDMVYVTDIKAESLAARLELRVGDFLRSINDKAVASLEDVKQALADTSDNSAVKIEIQRDENAVVLKNK